MGWCCGSWTTPRTLPNTVAGNGDTAITRNALMSRMMATVFAFRMLCRNLVLSVRAVSHLLYRRWVEHAFTGCGKSCTKPAQYFLVGAPAFTRGKELSLIHISEPTRLGMISYAVFC